MSTPPILLEHNGDVARLILNRPKERNALLAETLQLICALTRSLDEQVKVLVLEANGPSFSVGFDLMAMGSLFLSGGVPNKDGLHELAQLGRDAVDSIQNVGAITVVVAQGHAVGGGMLLAAACDLRVMAEDTVLSVPEVDLGLPLAWGGVPLLTRELGASRTREMILTGRRVRAASLPGFVHHSVPPNQLQETAQTLIAQLCEKPRHAVSLIKQQLAGRADDEALFAQAILHPDFLQTALRHIQKIRGVG